VKWRIVLYELLTQLIVWLGKLRTRLTDGRGHLVMQRKHARTFYATNNEAAECCDCGLVHVHYPLHNEEPRYPHFRMVPLRPRDYRYRLRLSCDPPSQFVDESHLDIWTGKPK